MSLAPEAAAGAESVLAGYRPAGPDELVGPDGLIRPGSLDLASTVDLLGVAGLRTRAGEATRIAEDEGVTYGAGRRWSVDPLPVVVEAGEWSRLRAGLVQRAELLDLVLTDLYGARTLLRRGVVPPEVVLAHSGFVREADRIRLPGPRQLFLSATDVARDADGTWRVVEDRTQAPSGVGYAMQNRRVVSRVMPSLYRNTRLERLRGWFHTMRQALQEVAPVTAEAPRVVLMTPGPGSETAFDQAFLASLLGFPLVEGEDLTVRQGRLLLRALGRMDPVDVLLRRVDAAFSDPLELRGDSQLGVPGLLHAGRTGAVSVVNPVGAGVLENPGLLPYLPAVARALMDSDLLLDSATTYWCGVPAQRELVLDRLDTLVVKRIDRGVGRASVFGWELSGAQRQDLADRVRAEPYRWSAQEVVEASTVPVVTDSGLEPRRMVLRGFAVAHGGAYEVMSGGLARVAAERDSHLVVGAAGAVSKDVWVLQPEPASGAITLAGVEPAAARPVSALPGISAAPALSSRVAEDLFWLGRYAERAEDAVRLLRVCDDLAEDHSLRPGSPGGVATAVMLRALTRVSTTWPGFTGPDAEPALRDPRPELLALVVDADRAGTLAHAVRATTEIAFGVRELLSTDTWMVLGSLDRVLAELARADADTPLPPTLSRVLEGLLALSGLAAESMVRDPGWFFMDAGKRIERALQVLAVLRATLDQPHPSAVAALVLEAVLVVGESVITHRRRHPGGTSGEAAVQTVLDLLLRDRGNPRSVAFQLDRLADDLTQLPHAEVSSGGIGSALRTVAVLLRDTERIPVGEPAALARALDVISSGLADLADQLQRVHFVHVAPLRPLGMSRWSA